MSPITLFAKAHLWYNSVVSDQCLHCFPVPTLWYNSAVSNQCVNLFANAHLKGQFSSVQSVPAMFAYTDFVNSSPVFYQCLQCLPMPILWDILWTVVKCLISVSNVCQCLFCGTVLQCHISVYVSTVLDNAHSVGQICSV